MSGVSDDRELPRSTSGSESELSSESSVETCDSDFIPYDESLEPFATEHEVAEYEEQVAQEEEEEQMLLSRFSGVDVRIWYVHVVFCGCFFSPPLLIHIHVYMYTCIHPAVCLFVFTVRCKCSHCSLEHVVKAEECRCCMEVDRCRERMEEVEKDGECITVHPGFQSVCLDRWVLQTAGIGLKTKRKKSYTTMLAQGDRAESE